MSLEKALLALYIILPFLAAGPIFRFSRGSFAFGAFASAARVIILFALLRPIVFIPSSISLTAVLANGYPLDFTLSLDPARFGFLLTAELCFLLAHWMISVTGEATIVSVFLSLAQGICSLFVLSDNTVTTGGLLMLAGAVFFYLVRFSIDDGRRNMAELISRRMYILHFLLGGMMIVWGIVEFGTKDLVFAKGSGSHLGLLIWIALMVMAVPLPPWSRWFGHSVENLPEGVTVTLVAFFAAVALRFSSLFSVVYPDMNWKQKLVLYLLGICGCAFSIAGLFASSSRRRMLGSLPSFFFSLILVSVGVSKSVLVLSAYFSCLFVPVFTGMILYASVMRVSNSLQKVLVGMLFALIVGIPGTPVFQIFSGIGARSLEMGTSYALVFGLLWFFYFCANVHICRRIFVDEKSTETGPRSRLESVPLSFAGYCIFLMCFIIVATQVAGGIL